jgi:hypothetical protein
MMRRRKWVMRWQVSLMPDPAMIPDATVFLQASQHFKSTTITTIAQDPMVMGLDPTIMVFLQAQEEENNMTQQDIPMVNE